MSEYGPRIPEGPIKSFGVAAPPESPEERQGCSLAIGPALPPGFKLSANGAELSTDDGGTSSSSLGAIATSSNEESRDLYGPSLPPGFAEPAKQEIIGPVLPPGFAASTASSQTPARRKSIIGPTVPPDFLKIAQAEEQSFGGDDDSSSDSFIGPKPSEAVGEDYAGNQAALDFDRRATKMKRHLEGKDIDTEPQREAWMTELPDNLGLRIGLGARTFRKNMEDPTADRSMWTDSPADKERKAEKKRSKKDEEEPARLRRQNKKEEELTEQLAHYNKEKRSESLLDMHRKKRKVEKKAEVNERKEFNREEDLKISHIDAKASKALISKAALLRTKFAPGESKFL